MRGQGRLRGLAGLVLAAFLQAAPVHAQAVAGVPQTAVLTLDEERLFTESRFGKAVLAAHDREVEALIAENRRIEADLEAEERTLTDRRAGMSKADFAPLSAAFNEKVEGIRSAQKAKSDALNRRFEEERRRFFTAASPILAQVMQERGAVAIISKRAVIAGFENIDITEAAVARLDAVLGAGPSVVVAPPDGAPAETPAEP